MAQITIDEARLFNDAMGPEYEKLADEIAKNLAKGMAEGAAVDAAVATTGYKIAFDKSLFDSTFSSINRAMRIEAVDGEDAIALRRWWLNHKWPGQSLTLAETITEHVKLPEIKQVIRDGMKAQRTWVEISKGLGDKQLISGDIAGHIKDLEQAARRVMAGDTEALTEYRRLLNRSKQQVERLAAAGAPSQRLKKAYANVIRQTEKMSKDGLEKAMRRATVAKMRSNADRIARTEIARGYIEGTYEQVLADDDVVGIRYHLSSSHPEADICDFHTGANLYNLGPGGYPLNNLPPYPFHPNCLCVTTNIYTGDAKALDSKKAQDFLNRQSEKRKKQLLGVKGAESFKKSPERWRGNLKQYRGHEEITKLRGRIPI